MKHILQIFPLRRSSLAVILFLALACRASAHAFLDYSLPAVGSVITNSPKQILICFTENLKLNGSWIKVRNAKGQQVDKKNSHCDHIDWAKLYVSLPKLPPGTYKVYWHALGADNHETQGHFEFTIKPTPAN